MTTEKMLAVALLIPALAACGGGGGSAVLTAASSDEITTQPVGQDPSTFAEVSSTSGVSATSPFASLANEAGRILVTPDFNVELRVDGQTFDGPALVSTIKTDPTDRLYATSYSFDGGDAVVVLNAANGMVIDGSTSVDGSLDYASFGVWFTGNGIDLASGLDDITASDFGAFFGVVQTALADMPNNGTATYRGSVIAAEQNNVLGTSQLLTGQMTMTANFASNRLDGAMSLSDQSGLTVASLNTGDVSISGNTFAGGITSDRGHTGRMEGTFAGPEAAEIAGAFQLENAGSSLQGAFGGAR